MSKTETPYTKNDTPQSVAETLHECSNERCNRLAEWLTTPEIGFSELGHEDIFYPLRHHHELVLVVEKPNGDTRGYEMQSDMVFFVDEEEKNFKTAVDPFSVKMGLDTPNRVSYTTKAKYGE